LQGVVGEEQLAVMVIQHHRRTIHLRVQQRVTGQCAAVDTHTVEVILVLLERVTGYGEYIPVTEVPFAGGLRFINGKVIAVVKVVSKVGGLRPIAEEPAIHGI